MHHQKKRHKPPPNNDRVDDTMYNDYSLQMKASRDDTALKAAHHDVDLLTRPPWRDAKVALREIKKVRWMRGNRWQQNFLLDR